MAARALSRDDLAFGRAVLLATDTLDMGAEGAFWLRDIDQKEWRFFLVTSLFERLGPTKLYLRLNEFFEKRLSSNEAQDFMYGLPARRNGWFQICAST